MTDQLTIFDKIVQKQIPASIVYEDELCLAFKDVNPQAKVHCVLIPKNKEGLTQLSLAQEQNKPLLGHLMWAASQVAKIMNLEQGWRLVVNDGPQGWGEQLTWPPGTKGPGGEY